jgi:hypothetical protein
MLNLLRKRRTDIARMGFELRDLGTHSIRKGATSYLNSLPGGPPAAAILIRGGWTMGNIQDRYVKYVEAGDQYVGRCIALNPILNVELAASPPFFDIDDNSDDANWVSELVSSQFPAVSLLVGFGKLCRMCLASILYHRSWIFEKFNANHVFRVSSVALRSDEVIEKLSNQNELIKVTYPWSDNNNHFSGVPPHVALLQEIRIWFGTIKST